MGLAASSTRSEEESRKILSSKISSESSRKILSSKILSGSSHTSSLSSRRKKEEEEAERTAWKEWRVEESARESGKSGREGRELTNKSGARENADKRPDAAKIAKRDRPSITKKKSTTKTIKTTGINRGGGGREENSNLDNDRLEFRWTENETTTTTTRREMRISFDRRDLSWPLARTVDSVSRQDNWPPLPSACPVGPCFYQDISVDIPLEFQKIVRMLYYLWMFHALMLLLNILGGLGVFVAFGEGATFGLAIVYFIIFTPFSYICWFRPIYKAFRSDSSFNFMVFFFVFSFQLIVSVINAIGVPSMGTWSTAFTAARAPASPRPKPSSPRASWATSTCRTSPPTPRRTPSGTTCSPGG
ncbi:uncharacterized protein LOC134779139 isoform X4 [Penaeus indicus]|uniref:uncharacterized protein LOC134779139 isoform X4 n=1 Tax=Penaeus indicus TaxID=29960 RepID=UPI00300C6944